MHHAHRGCQCNYACLGVDGPFYIPCADVAQQTLSIRQSLSLQELMSDCPMLYMQMYHV